MQRHPCENGHHNQVAGGEDRDICGTSVGPTSEGGGEWPEKDPAGRTADGEAARQENRPVVSDATVQIERREGGRGGTRETGGIPGSESSWRGCEE